jgi:hypothetical protein
MRLDLFFRRRVVWLPTWLGLLLFVAASTTPIVFWALEGEKILSANAEVPHDVLVVEGWIMDEPVQAAGKLFLSGGYRYAVAAGSYTGEKWFKLRWSTAEEARKNLALTGVPADRIVLAQAPDVEAHRTYATAVTAKAALDARGIKPTAVTVYTLGAHGFRSRLVFQKVFGPGTPVGVITWKPPEVSTVRWWRDSDRAVDMMKETLGCVWEWAFDSGR